MMDFNLKNKVALVTGGGHGLGREICYKLAEEGTKVAVNYFKSSLLAKETVIKINNNYGIQAIAVPGDVSVVSGVNDVFNSVIAEFGTIDILVNNAAISPTSSLADTDLKTWNETLQVNLTGVFLISQLVAKHLLNKNKKGRIINIASTAAFSGSSSGRAHYDASKGGIISFTFSLARELGPYGITVNSVAPGYMLTELTRDRYLANKEKYLSDIPLGRFGELNEIADVVVFLASERSSYITGAVINVSGGLQMR